MRPTQHYKRLSEVSESHSVVSDSLQPHGLSMEFSRPAYWSGFSSVQFSCSVVSDSLWPHEPQHARPPCPSPTPRVHSDSRPLSQWCHPTISCSVLPFSSCLQSLPASRSFSKEWVLRIRWPKYWSFSFKFSLSNEHSGLISFRMNWLDLLAVQGTLMDITYP